MITVETAKMSERGQIIIPKDIREYIKAKENTLFSIMPIGNDAIIMKKLDREKLINEFRSIRASVKDKLTQNDVNDIVREVRRKRKSK